MKFPHRLLAVASAAFFIATPALAQNSGTVTNHAFVLGKGAGQTGYTSLLCGSAQLAVGQSAADPICKTITGDVTITAAGVTAIGATKVTNAMLAAMAANTTKCNATAGSAVPTDCTASTMRTNIGVVIGTNVQAWDADLDCIAANSTAGLMAYTGAGTCAYRTLTAPAAGFTITNPAGTAGNPTFVLANDLAALEALGSTGIARRTGTDAWSVGTAVTNAELATMAANTVKANATGGSATPTDVTAATARSSSLLNVDSFTGHGDSIYTILATDRTVGTNAAFTASRTWTLPAASAVNPGQETIVADFQGTVTGTNTLVISRSGSDTVNGGTSVTISSANGAYLLKSDGTSKWTAQALGAAAGGGVSSVSGAGLATGTVTTSGNITVTAAVQSDQETGTSNTVAVTPGTQKYHPSAAKAAAYFVVSGGAISAQTTYNATVSYSSLGNYNVTFTVPFSSANYQCSWGYDASTLAIPRERITSASVLNVNLRNLADSLNVEALTGHVICYGDQ